MAKKSGQTIINGMPHSDEELERFRGQVRQHLNDTMKRIPARGGGSSPPSDSERFRNSVNEKLNDE